MLKRIYADTNANSLLAHIDFDVSFKGILIRIRDETQVGTITLQDVGRVKYYKNGREIISADFAYLSRVMSGLFGSNSFLSTINAVAELAVYIPRRWFDNNVETVRRSDNAYLEINFTAAFATAFAAPTEAIEVYVDLELGVQKYDLKITHQQETLASGTAPFSFRKNNILAVFMTDLQTIYTMSLDESAINNVVYSVGGMNASATVGALLNWTQATLNIEGNVDDTDDFFAKLYMAEGDISSRLFDNLNIEFTADGAASVQLLFFNAEFDIDRLNATMNLQVDRVRSIINAKAEAGQLATVTAIRKLSNRSAG